MNKIFLIILVILILYFIYNCFNSNEGFNTNPKTLSDIDAIKNLAAVAKDLQTVNGITIPGSITVKDNLGIGTNTPSTKTVIVTGDSGGANDIYNGGNGINSTWNASGANAGVVIAADNTTSSQGLGFWTSKLYGYNGIISGQPGTGPMPLGLYGKTVTLATGTKGKVENAVVINQDGRTTINRGLVTDNMYFGSTDNNTSFSNAPGMSRWFNPNINADHTHVSSGGANSQLFLISKQPVKILKNTTWGSSGDLEVDGNLTVGGRKPFIIKKYNLNSWTDAELDNSFSVTDWFPCNIGTFMGGHNPNHNNGGLFWGIDRSRSLWANNFYIKNNKWMVRNYIPCHGDARATRVEFTILWINKNIVDVDNGYEQN